MVSPTHPETSSHVRQVSSTDTSHLLIHLSWEPYRGLPSPEVSIYQDCSLSFPLNQETLEWQRHLFASSSATVRRVGLVFPSSAFQSGQNPAPGSGHIAQENLQKQCKDLSTYRKGPATTWKYLSAIIWAMRGMLSQNLETLNFADSVPTICDHPN